MLKGVESGDRLGGFVLGLLANIKLAEKLSLAPELTLFSRKGLTEIPFVTTGDPALDAYFAEPTKSALVLDYMEIPVRVMARLGRFELGGGPFVGFLSGASERFRAETGTGEELLHTHDVTGDYAHLNYGFVLEAAWIITKPRGGEGLVFHIRYQGGLADVIKDPAVPGSVRTSGLQVFLSFPFIR